MKYGAERAEKVDDRYALSRQPKAKMDTPLNGT